jgi:AcrR family transcriptional regulator
MARPREPGNSRVSIDDWIQAGFIILAEEGLNALKLERLCARLGVTKGSFYWHFADIAAYRESLVRSWGEVRDADRRVYAIQSELAPRERLSAMMTLLVNPQHWALERAMREWGRSDEAVASSVRASDRTVLCAVRQAFLDLGFDPDDADLRANAVFAIGIGFLHLSGPRPTRNGAERRERFLDFMIRP